MGMKCKEERERNRRESNDKWQDERQESELYRLAFNWRQRGLMTTSSGDYMACFTSESPPRINNLPHTSLG